MKKKFPLIIYLFLLLFLPPVVKNINLLFFLSFFSFIVVIVKYRKSAVNMLNNENLKRLSKIALLYYGWHFICIIINILITKEIYIYNYAINFYSVFLVFPLIFICLLHVVLYSKAQNISFDEIIECTIIAGLIQSGISILSFLIPELKTLLIDIMYKNTGEILYKNQYHVERRFFGFANNMLDSFGYGAGLLAVLPLFHSVKNNNKWLLSIPFLLIISFMNSRTGLVVFAIGFLFWLIFLIKEKRIKEYAKLLLCIVIGLVISIIAISIFNPATLDWIIRDFSSFFTSTTGTADTLFGTNFWKFPNNIFNVIFGTGYNVAAYGKMGKVLGFNSDVGYVNEIWKTGIIGLIILLFLFYNMQRISKKNATTEYKYFIIGVFVITLITHIKFYVLSCSPGITILMLYTMLFALNYSNNINKTKSCPKRKIINKEKKLISIIIPVYNVEQCLERCLKSIIRQTYENIEIILVNDGTPDNSGEICKKYAQKDKRVVYIEQKNQGLSAARNNGTKVAKGDYYIFIDSDDYVNIHFVEELYNTMISCNVDLAVCNYEMVYEEDVDINNAVSGNIEIYEGNDKFINLYNDKKTAMTVAWNKIYNKNIFEDISYPVGKVHEDEFVICSILDKVEKVAYTDCKYYYYYQRPNSITASYNYKRTDILEGLLIKTDFFKEKGNKKMYANALYDYYYQLINQKNLLIQYLPDKKDKINEIENNMNLLKKEVLTNIHLNPLKKLKIILMLLGFLKK